MTVDKGGSIQEFNEIAQGAADLTIEDTGKFGLPFGE